MAFIMAVIAYCYWLWLSNDTLVSCPTPEGQSLFVAVFDSFSVGTPPPSGSSNIYGPPGADIFLDGSIEAVVTDTTELTNNALRISRTPTFNGGSVGFSLGDPGDVPCAGIYIVSFDIVGERVPHSLISSPRFYFKSLTDKIALKLHLYDGAYHYLHNGSAIKIEGDYDTSSVHNVQLNFDMDQHVSHVCIDGSVVASNIPFIDANFGHRGRFEIAMPAAITEAFDASVIVDELRVQK